MYGKVDQYRDCLSPYAEIVAAFDQLVARGAPPDRIRRCIGATTEARILTRLIPSFRNLTTTPITASTPTASDDNTKEDEHENSPDDAILTLASERLIVAFRAFLRDFCCAKYPLILAIDDLQWGDDNSIRLLGEIVNDASITNFLFLGLYRDEIEYTFDVGRFQSLPHTNITDLPIGPLSVGDVDSLVGMIVETSNGDDASVSADLSYLVHRKTLGNPYFVVQFLEMLHSRQLLTYNYSAAKWEWTMSAIAETTNVSEGVVDILRARIGRLTPQLQRILIVASFLGFMVDTLLLEFLMQELGTMDHLRLPLTIRRRLPRVAIVSDKRRSRPSLPCRFLKPSKRPRKRAWWKWKQEE